MEEKIIKLNRNIFCLELMAFSPLVFLFGVGGYFIHGLGFENDIDKIFIAIGFIVEVIVGIIVAKKIIEVLFCLKILWICDIKIKC